MKKKKSVTQNGLLESAKETGKSAIRTIAGTADKPTLYGKALRTTVGRTLGRTVPGIRNPVTAVVEDDESAELAKPLPGKATSPSPRPPSSGAGRHGYIANEDGEMEEDMGGDDLAENEFDTEEETDSLNQEYGMKLKPNEKKQLVGDLTANCSCWKHKGSEEILNAMSDEQLIALSNQSGILREVAPVINQIRQDFELPDTLPINELPAILNAAAFDGSGGVTGGGDTRANGEDDNPDDEESYNDEGTEGEMEEEEYEGDDQEKNNHQGNATQNRRRKPMTTNQWLATAPPEVQVAVRNAMRLDAEEKYKLIESITANVNNPYDEETLNSMTTEQLRPLAQLAAPRRAQPQVRRTQPRQPVANFFGSQGFGGVNNASDEDEGLLEPPTINWEENAKELRHDRD